MARLKNRHLQGAAARAKPGEQPAASGKVSGNERTATKRIKKRLRGDLAGRYN
jgi:hypothetical protein